MTAGAGGTASGVWWAATGDTSAQPMALIHGSLDRSSGMLKLSRRLDTTFRVVRYDRRGYGRSLALGGPFDVDHQVGDLIGVLDDARITAPCVLFGHSYGGNVALAAAARHPERVRAVVVYETPLPWLDWWPSSTPGGQARTWTGDPAEAAERFMRRLVGDATWARLPPATRHARRQEGPALIGELAAISTPPWTPPSIGVPVLAMCGEHGQPHHQQSTAQIAEWFGSVPHTIAGARHFGPNTHPDAVAEAISEWLDRVSAPTPPHP